MNKNLSFVNIFLHILGFSFCIVPPTVAALCYFPFWVTKDAGTVLAGGGVLVVTLCAFPLYKSIRKVLETSSSYVMWLILFCLFFALSRVANEMTVISLVGLMGNLAGALCFLVAKSKVRRSSNEGWRT